MCMLYSMSTPIHPSSKHSVAASPSICCPSTRPLHMAALLRP